MWVKKNSCVSVFNMIFMASLKIFVVN